MIRALSALDRALATSRPGWRWIGEASLVFLGVHMAADRLDDAVAQGLSSLGWLGPDQLIWVSWLALGLEILVAARVIGLLLLSAGAPPPTRASLKENWSIEALVRPAFWLPTAAAGAWVLGMAVEDALHPLIGGAAYWVGATAAVVAMWRLGFAVVVRLLGGLFPPKRRTEGLIWAPALLLTAALAARYGLPVWGWL